jgi:mRNA interferase MazF
MNPTRGEIWRGTLDPVPGREQAGTRPVLVVSEDRFNRSPAGLVVVVPLTTRREGVPLHVRVEPPEGGHRSTSFVKCEDIRSVSKSRPSERLGEVSASTMAEVEDRLRRLLALH